MTNGHPNQTPSVISAELAIEQHSPDPAARVEPIVCPKIELAGSADGQTSVKGGLIADIQVPLVAYRQLLPAPRTARALFESFAIYRQDEKLASVLGYLDYDGMTIEDVYRAGLNEAPPEKLPPTPIMRNQLRAILLSPKFVRQVRAMACEAFPEKRRGIFVHVPKCAGTDLIDTLRRRSPVLHEADFRPGETHPESIFWSLRNFALGLAFSPEIVLTGHERLDWYHANGLIRPGDHVFTTIRDPVDIVYSHISYALTAAVQSRTQRRADAVLWLNRIGLEELPAGLDASAMADIGRQFLRSKQVVGANRICHFLGDGTAQGALDAVIEHDVEIVSTKRYSEWRDARYRTPRERKINASIPYFTLAMASAEDRALIADYTEEDRKFFAIVDTAFKGVSTPAITGRMLKQQSSPKRRRSVQL